MSAKPFNALAVVEAEFMELNKQVSDMKLIKQGIFNIEKQEI